MTDAANPYAHLQPYERAARILCGITGEDPDQAIQTPHPLFPTVLDTRPQWHFAAEGLIHLSQMLAALSRARDEERAEQAAAPDPQMELDFGTKH